MIGCRRFGLFFFFSVERRTFISIVVQSKNPFFQSFNSIQLFFSEAPPPKKVPRRVSVRTGTPKGYQKTGFAAALADQVDLARTSILGKKVA